MFAAFRKSLFVLLLPLFLLLAQQAAVAHAIQHHSGRGTPAQKQDQTAPDKQVCEECFAFAHLSGATTASVPALVIVDGGYVLVSDAAESFPSARQLANRNRGPPDFL